MLKTFYISGMHCVSCELLIEKELQKIDGLKVVKLSHKNGELQLESDVEINEDVISGIVNRCGFKLCEKKEHVKDPSESKKNTFVDYLEILAVMVVLFNIYLFFRNVDFTRFFPNITGQVSVFISLLFGLIASVSTCLLLVGGIVLSFGSICHTEENKNHPLLARAVPHLYFHSGRVFGFALLGGILGLIGGKITYSFSFTGYLTLFVAVVMFYMGLYILNIVPSITKVGFHLPKAMSRNIHSVEKKDNHFAPIVLGVLTFFLPCGFTQSMQLAAVASGSFVMGALIMGAFALGTLPVLLSIGMGATYAKDLKFATVKRCAGVLILFFAIYSMNSGIVLAGYSSPIAALFAKVSPNNSSVSKEVVSEVKSIDKIDSTQQIPRYQVVKMDVDYRFKPTEFIVKRGIPVRWEINGINVTGCTNEVVIPRLKLSKKINPGLNVLEFTPTKTGRLNFSCWMGMQGGSFIVVENDIPQSAGKSEYSDEEFVPGGCGSCEGDSCSSAQEKAKDESAPCGCGRKE